jgi:hypothetical protein
MEIINLGALLTPGGPQTRMRLGQLAIRHGDEELIWLASNYDQPAFTEPENLFFHINDYWSLLPATRQQEIFDLYKEAHETLNTVPNFSRMMVKLQNIVERLYVLHPKNELSYYLITRNNVCSPSTLPDQYGTNPEERTYLRGHYHGLTVLVLALRVMVPIWAEFIRVVRADAVERKEILAMRLIVNTWLMGTVDDQGNHTPDPDMHKLRRMVDAMASNAETPLVAVIHSVGSEQFPEWLFAMTVIRRVAIGELSQTNTNINIVSTVYKTINVAVDKGGKNFGRDGDIREKNPDGGRGRNEEDNTSVIEGYKPRQDISPGDLMVFSVFAEDLRRLIDAVDPTVPEEKVRICYDALNQARMTGQLTYHQHQLIMTNWVLSEPLPPSSERHLEATATFNAVVAVQAILWHWGFTGLAAMMSVSSRPRSDQYLGEATEFRSRTTSENLRKLSAIYPYYRPSGKGSERKPGDNFGTVAIEQYNQLLSLSAWLCLAPPEILKEANLLLNDGMVAVPQTLRNDLASLFIHLYERS